MQKTLPYLDELQLCHLIQSLENLSLEYLLKASSPRTRSESLESFEIHEILQTLAHSVNCATRALQNRFKDTSPESKEIVPKEKTGTQKEKTDSGELAVHSALSRHLEMDLSFVTERILSLSFTPGTQAAVYRDGLRQAAEMLLTKHGQNYMVYNLSLQQCPDLAQWNPRVMDVGWLERLAPPLERLCSVCKALDSWLQADPQHVAVLFSRTGLEHVGVIVAAYLKLLGISVAQDQSSLDRFAMEQFLKERVGPLKQASNKRYIDYFGGLLSGTIKVNSSPLFLNHISVTGIPIFESNNGCRPFFKVYQGSSVIHTSPIYHVNPSSKNFTMSLDKGLHLRGDILIKCYHRYSQHHGRDTIFTIQFHTCAVADHVMVFQKLDLDDACEDSRFPEDGSVQLHFSSSEEINHLPRNSCLSEPCLDDPIVRFDSYEAIYSQGDHPDYVAGGRYTHGPVDGSLYAIITKQKTPSATPLLRETVFVSTDSGISSAGVRRETHLSGSSGHSPPHSGHSEESAPVFSDPSPSPSPTSGSSDLKMPIRIGTSAGIHHGRAASAAVPQPAPPSSQTSELDQLLTGMLMNVENIPDIRASQTRNLHADIDVDSIQVNFDLPPAHKSDPAPKNYIYESDTVRRIATTPKKAVEDIPYHAREDSKPFSYGIVSASNNTSATSSPLIQRKNLNLAGQSPRTLQSPQLVRKISSGSMAATPQLTRKFSEGVGVSTPKHATLTYSVSFPFHHAQTSQPIATSSPQPSDTHSEEMTLEESSMGSSSFENKLEVDSGSPWLQRQRQKLQDRKDSFRFTDRRQKDTQLISELRNAHSSFSSSSNQRPGDDGYLSDATLNTSREPSPDSAEAIYATPLHINTSAYGRNNQDKQQTVTNGKLNGHSTSFQTHRSPSLSSAKVTSQQHPALFRQKSDMTFDRTPLLPKRTDANVSSPPHNNYSHAGYRTIPAANTDSINGLLTTVVDENSTKEDSVVSWSSSMSGDESLNRPTTPGFPVVPRTPYLNARHFSLPSCSSPVSTTALPPKSPSLHRKERSPSPSSSSLYMGQSRRSSISGSSEPHDVSSTQVNFVKDNSNLWYKPHVSREETINLLKDKPPGTFIVRDSNSFPGAFGLALKVATPPPQAASKNLADPTIELVRHFLIEPTSKGVRIKGCPNEPVFGSLSALVYQHSVTPLALPVKLVLPENDLGEDVVDSVAASPVAQLIVQGASCNVTYLFTMDTESLTGPQAIYRAVSSLFQLRPSPASVTVHFKVSAQGITLTDNERKLFFRRHYPTNAISFCGLDPEDRRWTDKNEDKDNSSALQSRRCFGFVARKPASKTDNQCHIFAELEPQQPAAAIVSFVTKVLANATTFKSNI